MFQGILKLSLFTLIVLVIAGCSDSSQIASPESTQNGENGVLSLSPDGFLSLSSGGALVVNGWYEEEEIYYIDGGPEEGVTERGENQLYVIGSTPRLYQAQVVLHIPGEPGYSPHWNVNLVHTAGENTVQDIIDAGFAAENHQTTGGENNLLFDDAEDILDAQAAGLVTIDRPGAVVLCPIVAEEAADAPGNSEAPEDEFLPFPDTF